MRALDAKKWQNASSNYRFEYLNITLREILGGRTLHAIILSAANKAGISYNPSNKLELKVKLYLDHTTISFHDIDNRLKDIMDALQGRAGGSKKFKMLSPIIPNDKQIYHVTIEKALPPKQSRDMGTW